MDTRCALIGFSLYSNILHKSITSLVVVATTYGMRRGYSNQMASDILVRPHSCNARFWDIIQGPANWWGVETPKMSNWSWGDISGGRAWDCGSLNTVFEHKMLAGFSLVNTAQPVYQRGVPYLPFFSRTTTKNRDPLGAGHNYFASQRNSNAFLLQSEKL